MNREDLGKYKIPSTVLRRHRAYLHGLLQAPLLMHKSRLISGASNTRKVDDVDAVAFVQKEEQPSRTLIRFGRPDLNKVSR